MKSAGLPPNEEQRLITARNYLPGGSERLPALDDLARLVALALDLPIALVSVVDESMLRLRGRSGVEVDAFDRETSLCAHVVRHGVPLIVPDVEADRRFADSPLVTGYPNVRFYAGVPLRAVDGHIVGVLSVADRAPRTPRREQGILELSASQAMMHLDAHRNARLLDAERELLRVHRELFQLTPELHCTLDANLRFDELSPSWEQVLGWKREVLRAQTLADLIHPGDYQRTVSEAQRLIERQGSRYDFETRCQHVNGHWVPLSWAWLARGGRIFATARDMTSYHAKEDALLAANRELQDREQKLRVLFDSMAEGALMQDAAGNVTHSNAAAERILKLSRGQLIKLNANGPPRAPLIRRDGSLMPDAERPAAHALRTGEVVSDRVMGLLFSAEETTWISVNAVPLRASGTARPSGVVMTFRDISEHYRMQERLAQSEANFRALVASLPVGIAVSHGKVLCYVNGALLRILGYDEPEELVGRQTFDVVHPRSEPVIRERYRQMEAGTYPGAGVLECVKRDGGTVLIEVTSMPTRYDGQDANIAIVRDVTEERGAKQALLESLSQKETLLKEIHHRVKNNLQVIASLLRLGRNYVADPGALCVFDDSIARVHSIALIHERLYQSKDLAVIDLPAYLQGLVSELVRAGTSDRRVRAEVEADPVALDIDRCVPLGLIVNELVTNSLKHAFSDGAVAEPQVSVRLHERGSSYELSIRDNGRGMGSAAQREGSLGLLLVSSLVRQLRGQHRESDDGGTHWRVEFPRVAGDRDG